MKHSFGVAEGLFPSQGSKIVR